MLKKRLAYSAIAVLGIFILCATITYYVIDRSPSVFDPSVKVDSSKSFSQPLSTLNKKQSRDFILGKSIFHGVSNDNRTLEKRNIGPLFNAQTCGDCHVADGTGDPKVTPSLLIKLFNKETLDGADPIYGGQIQNQATFGTEPEATIAFDINENVELQNLNNGNLDPNTKIYKRIASPIFGLGLIEAIPDSFFRDHADPNDNNNDGISGRIPYLTDPTTGKKTIGRFGWKSTQATVKNQSLLAAFEDIGLNNSLHSVPECSARRFCVSEPELTKSQEQSIVAYARSLAPPRSREMNKESKKGQETFRTLGCSSCHTEQIKLEKSDLVTQENTVIYPKSDFLLHSMGKVLSDSSDIYGRKADEFRTAPLWGLGLIEKVNGSLNLLHDGRAKTIDQAIYLHGGEARKSRNSYVKLSKEDKDLLIAYLNTL